MATLPDSALPNCDNPEHPPSLPRRMLFLQYRDNAYVFGCQACKDVNRKLSVRVMTDEFFRREVRKQLAKEGRLLTAPPQTRQPQFYRQQPTTIDWDSSSRRSKDGKFELVRYEALPNGNLHIQMAVSGKLAPQMDDHVASRHSGPRKRIGRGLRGPQNSCSTCMAIRGIR